MWRGKTKGDLIHSILDRLSFRVLVEAVVEMYKRDLWV